ncbi:hypothetical protein NMY22_g16031 [Coprinellus aureogranulatus]|nr:hypothetical protein NMY22_g16031 [Coprinellus aureogranulatus]
MEAVPLINNWSDFWSGGSLTIRIQDHSPSRHWMRSINSILETSPDVDLTVKWLHVLRVTQSWESETWNMNFTKQLLETYQGEAEYVLGAISSLVGLDIENGNCNFTFYHKTLLDFLEDENRSRNLYLKEDDRRALFVDLYYRVLKNRGPLARGGDEDGFVGTVCSELHLTFDPNRQYEASDVEWWLKHLQYEKWWSIQSMYAEVHATVLSVVPLSPRLQIMEKGGTTLLHGRVMEDTNAIPDAPGQVQESFRRKAKGKPSSAASALPDHLFAGIPGGARANLVPVFHLYAHLLEPCLVSEAHDIQHATPQHFEACITLSNGVHLSANLSDFTCFALLNMPRLKIFGQWKKYEPSYSEDDFSMEEDSNEFDDEDVNLEEDSLDGEDISDWDEEVESDAEEVTPEWMARAYCERLGKSYCETALQRLEEQLLLVGSWDSTTYDVRKHDLVEQTLTVIQDCNLHGGWARYTDSPWIAAWMAEVLRSQSSPYADLDMTIFDRHPFEDDSDESYEPTSTGSESSEGSDLTSSDELTDVEDEQLAPASSKQDEIIRALREELAREKAHNLSTQIDAIDVWVAQLKRDKDQAVAYATQVEERIAELEKESEAMKLARAAINAGYREGTEA